MAVMKNAGSVKNPRYVVDEELSTSPNPHGTEEAFLHALESKQPKPATKKAADDTQE